MKQLLYVCLLVLATVEAQACDGCGVCMSSMTGDFLNATNRSFLSLSYDYKTFASTPLSHHDIYDVFRTYRLSYRTYISNRFYGEVSTNYQQKYRDNSDVQSELNGFGDLSLGAGYVFAHIWLGTTQFFGQIGASVILPTSKHDDKLHDKSLPQSFNLGKGSVGYGSRISMAFKRMKYGLLFNASLSEYSRNSNGYKYGTEMSTRASVYYMYNLDSKVKLLLSGGFMFDLVTKDTYKNGNQVDASGYRSTYIPGSIGLVYNKFSLIGEILLPLKTNIVNNELKAKSLLNIQFNYFL